MTLEMMRSGGRRWLVLGAVVMAAVAGCRHGGERESKKGGTRCPESESLTCMTHVECSMDRERGCEVCQCSPASSGTERNTPPTGMQPDRQWR